MKDMKKKRFLLTVYFISDNIHVTRKNNRLDMEQISTDDIKEIYNYLNGFEMSFVYSYYIYDYLKKRNIDEFENSELRSIL